MNSNFFLLSAERYRNETKGTTKMEVKGGYVRLSLEAKIDFDFD